MDRSIFEIYFNCNCRDRHDTGIFVAFIQSPSSNTSAADVYRNQQLPERLQSFLSGSFKCKVNPDINELPSLDAFFFAFTGESSAMVG